MKLKTYTASAGSGKTFRLTVEYISKLLKNPYSYKNTLAVTFTNKATNEMKTRILSVLWSIVHKPEEVKDEIKKIEEKFEHSLSQTEKDNATKALDFIIHDYHHFWIETIDSFFQRILRNMAKELGVSSGFEVLLSDKEYLKQVIEELKTDVETSLQLDKCLNDLIQSRIREGKKWNYETDMLDFVKSSKENMITEAYPNKEDELLEKISEETIDALAKVKEFEQKINKYIEEAKKLSEDLSVQSGEEYTKCLKQLIYSAFIDGYNIDSDKEGKILKDLSKTAKKSFNDIGEKNEALMNRFSAYYDRNFKKVKTLHSIYSSAYKTSLLLFINQRKQELLKSDNLFLLKNTHKLLNDVVGDENDVPFIYEKIDSRINNLMIDEFQDTSIQAWKNFTYLIKESIAKGGDCSVFGDIKQSIYRWNDGDWHILKELCDNQKGNKYGIETDPDSLKENWRTDEQIVEFNNKFFASVFPKYGKFEIESQTPQKNLGKGEIRISFVDKSETNKKSDEVMRKTVEEINRYIELGYEVDDIVLLFRDNNKAKKMAAFLKANTNYKPSSATAFILESNTEIQKIIYLLKYAADKNDSISEYYLKNILKIDNLDSLNQYTDSSISLIDLATRLIADFDINSQDTFVLAFCDKLTNYCLRFGNDIKKFIAHWNEKMREEEVVISKEQNTLELQTIHKSKGLEYKVVIIPFCDWTLVDNKRDYWFENPNKDSAVRVFPTKLRNLEKMGEAYREIGQKEQYMQIVDNINILYVAFTRAKHCLSIISQKPSEDKKVKEKDASEKNVAILLKEYLKEEEAKIVEESNCVRYEIGEENPKDNSIKEKKESSNPFIECSEIVNINTDSKFDFSGVRYALSKVADNFFETKEESSENTKALWGNLVHSVLSQIKTDKDIQKALSNVEINEREKVNDVLQSMLKFSESKHWFDGTYKVLNERSIVNLSNEEKEKTKRPDRIMIQDNEIVVVDYKFLEDLNDLQKYEEQIVEYGNLFREMGYENISLYLWGVESSFNKLTLDFGEVNQRIINVEF